MIKNIADKVFIEKLEEVFKNKGYAFFKNGDYNLNIIGIRSENKVANSFDDLLVCVFKVDGKWQVKKWEITTDAGTYWLKNPMNNKGTALLVPNQYKGVYGIRLHQNTYNALCQTWGNVSVYRDNNKDKILDYNKDSIDTGKFGINIHHSNPTNESLSVDRWSAGCQVFKKIKDFFEFMTLCQNSKDIYGNKFTYTLLEQKDLIKN